VSLFATVSALLDARGVAFALVGAEALAPRGSSRATVDLDLLTTARAVLADPFWSDLRAAGVRAEIRTGDTGDPLAGVVRLHLTGERPSTSW
jgi:hypothetical protein